jgi:hypothetical protein
MEQKQLLAWEMIMVRSRIFLGIIREIWIHRFALASNMHTCMLLHFPSAVAVVPPVAPQHI